MDESTKISRAKQLAIYREQMLARMRASRHADAPCFTYAFVLKEIAAIKIGISIDPLTRLCNLPQLHMRVEDVFDLERSVVVFAHRRQDARELERAVLQHHAQWRVKAPSGPVVYIDRTPTCFAPIRGSAGGKKEWLDASAYNDVLHFLLFADRRSPRPSISMGEWIKGLQEGAVQ
jgi:hypothetical protein